MKYSRDCRLAFEELSKIVQKVMACQEELTHYDAQQIQFAPKKSEIFATPGRVGANAACYGCLLASVELCILMLRALTGTPDLKRKVIEKIADSNEFEILHELYENNLRYGPKRSRRRIRDLLVNLMRNSPKLTSMLNSMMIERVTSALGDQRSLMAGLGRLVQPDMDLLQASIRLSDECWELRIQCIFRLFLDSLHIL
jgi:E3 ubiquitin-protein ligase UBR4